MPSSFPMRKSHVLRWKFMVTQSVSAGEVSEADAMSDELAFFISTFHIDVTKDV